MVVLKWLIGNQFAPRQGLLNAAGEEIEQEAQPRRN
jgi:hypothetical protein